jgi:hypothetical protein
LEQDDADREPSLGARENNPGQYGCGGNQTLWGNWNPVLPMSYLRAWQDMSLSGSRSASEAVSRCVPRTLLLNPISTEQLLYLS